MNVAKITFIALLAGLIAVGMGTTTYAFHSGGVAECEGCHSMHSPKAGGNNLLIGSDPSSTCLDCHQSDGDTGPTRYHVSTPATEVGSAVTDFPEQLTPGGDFGWLHRTYTYTASGTSYTEEGETHGHNIVALDKDYEADLSNTSSPGGSFLSANLGCHSCHDPHGKYRRDVDGNVANTGLPIKGSGSYNDTVVPTATEAVGVYRILAGSGYVQEDSGGGAVTAGFPGVPAAKAPSTYNQSEATNQVRVAYGVKTSGGHTTWGLWCGTCHGAMHSTGNYVHPVDQGLGSTLGLYNNYVKSGVMTGTVATSFLSLAPFARNSGDYTELAGLAGNAAATYPGPGTGDQVNCLSCHRAHASGFLHALRFDQGYEFMVKGGLYIGSDNPEITGGRAALQHRGRTSAEWQRAYYDRPASQFATYQRVLCNKCHAKD